MVHNYRSVSMHVYCLPIYTYRQLDLSVDVMFQVSGEVNDGKLISHTNPLQFRFLDLYIFFSNIRLPI